jgi:hypothetical protein
MPDRIERIAEFTRRIGIERLLFRFHWISRSRIGPAAKALRNHSTRPGLPRRGEKMVEALRPQAVGHCERTVKMGEIAGVGERRHLVNDDLRPGLEDEPAHEWTVESVGDQSRRACSFDLRSFCRSSRQARYLMPRRDEQRDEPAADRAGRARNQNAHRNTFLSGAARNAAEIAR